MTGLQWRARESRHCTAFLNTAVLALVGAGQAFAGAGESLDASYKEDGIIVSSAYSHGDNSQVAIYDGRADSMAVYTLYDRRYNTGLRLDNHNGSGSTVYSGKDATNYVRKVTACVNIQINPDRCGPDDRPGDGV